MSRDPLTLPGYDAWKTQSPPEYDEPDVLEWDEHPFPAALDNFIHQFCRDVGADTGTLVEAMEAKCDELIKRDRKAQGDCTDPDIY
jgi:hypothetical protein